MKAAGLKTSKPINSPKRVIGSGMQQLSARPLEFISRCEARLIRAQNRIRQGVVSRGECAVKQNRVNPGTHRHLTANPSAPMVAAAVLMMVFLGVFASPAHASVLPSDLPVLEEFKAGLGEPIGRVQRIRGDAVVMHEQVYEGYKVSKGLWLYKGDTLMTLEKGRLRIKLNDGSLLSQASNTKLTLNKSVYDEKKKSRSSFFGLALGKARFLVVKLFSFKRSEFKVKTPTAVCGVRGSDFALEVTPEVTRATAFENTEIEMVSLIDPTAPPVVLSDFMTSEVYLNQLPSAPVRLPEKEIDRIKKQFMPLKVEETQPSDESATTEKTTKKTAAATEAAGDETTVPLADIEGEDEPLVESVDFDQEPVFVSEEEAKDIGVDEAAADMLPDDDVDQPLELTKDVDSIEEPLGEEDTANEIKDEVKEDEIRMPDFPQTPE